MGGLPVERWRRAVSKTRKRGPWWSFRPRSGRTRLNLIRKPKGRMWEAEIFWRSVLEKKTFSWRGIFSPRTVKKDIWATARLWLPSRDEQGNRTWTPETLATDSGLLEGKCWNFPGRASAPAFLQRKLWTDIFAARQVKPLLALHGPGRTLSFPGNPPLLRVRDRLCGKNYLQAP